MKKFMALLLAFTIFATISACGKKLQEEASMEGYESLSFYELLDKYAQEQIEEEFDEDSGAEYEISHEEGWAQASRLDESDLSDTEKAITYSVRFEGKERGKTERVIIQFFMILDEEKEILMPVGLRIVENGDADEIYDEEEVKYTCRKVFDEVID